MSYEATVESPASLSSSRRLQIKALGILVAVQAALVPVTWWHSVPSIVGVQILGVVTLGAVLVWNLRAKASTTGWWVEVAAFIFGSAHSAALFFSPPGGMPSAALMGLLPLVVSTRGVRATWRWAVISALAAMALGVGPAFSNIESELDWQALMMQALLPILGVSALAAWLASARESDRREFERLRSELRDYGRREMIADRQRREFVTNMSHELRTPLAGILGLADLVVDDTSADGRRHHLHLLQESTRGLLAIVDDLLDAGRIESGTLRLDPSPTDIARLAQTAAGLLAPRAVAKGVVLNCRIDPTLPATLVADPVRVRQILLNLLANAVKFTESGEVELKVQWMGPNCRARFEVRDTGIGIAESAIPRLFSPFQQADSSTSRRFGGTGLGLSISKSLVDLMGGWIGVESRRGVGSTFWFELPLSPADEAGEGIEATDVADDRLAGRRILVVEDDPINRLVVVSKLEALGVEVSTAESGPEALELLSADPFDLVLMDCQIPGFDGYEATRRLRLSSGPLASIPVVALTAHSHPDERGRCLAAGMNDYLIKPVATEQLFRTLRDWLEVSEAASRAPRTKEWQA